MDSMLTVFELEAASFSIFFIEEYQFRGMFFVVDIFENFTL